MFLVLSCLVLSPIDFVSSTSTSISTLVGWFTNLVECPSCFQCNHLVCNPPCSSAHARYPGMSEYTCTHNSYPLYRAYLDIQKHIVCSKYMLCSDIYLVSCVKGGSGLGHTRLSFETTIGVRPVTGPGSRPRGLHNTNEIIVLICI